MRRCSKRPCRRLRGATDPELTLAEAPRLRRVIVNGDPAHAWELGTDAVASAAASVDDDQVEARRFGVRVRDTAVLMYTSGTTANPKGAMLSHEGLTRDRTHRGPYPLQHGRNRQDVDTPAALSHRWNRLRLRMLCFGCPRMSTTDGSIPEWVRGS